ncbi:MAG: FkbM family methyltransferase [Chitinophagales bacterium]|nr:FkbM family methyltransferase [Bacteroidota bacterium]MCB9043111.1 FkbM family methyltransferase [Chitinophagales bacterium]
MQQKASIGSCMNIPTKETLLAKLAQVQYWGEALRWRKFWRQPFTYLSSIFYHKCIYPFRHKGILRKAKLFWGEEMWVQLPAGMEILFTGGKAHDAETRLARFFIHQLQAGDCVIDIGAHYGYFSLLAAYLVGKNGKVLSFEAGKSTLEILQRNVAAHPQIKTFHQAIAAAQGEATFYEFSPLYSEYNTLEIEQFAEKRWFKNNPPEKFSVATRSLDDVIATEKIVPRLIKIDVEGAEAQIVAGSTQLLRSQNPFIVMEYLCAARDNLQHQKAAQLLKNEGFMPYAITQEGSLQALTDINAYLQDKQLETDNIVFCKEKNE